LVLLHLGPSRPCAAWGWRPPTPSWSGQGFFVFRHRMSPARPDRSFAAIACRLRDSRWRMQIHHRRHARAGHAAPCASAHIARSHSGWLRSHDHI